MALLSPQRVAQKRERYQAPHSRAFFLELLLNMLIFTLCAVVVLQVFVEGKRVTDESNALTHLTLEAKDLAGYYKVSDGEVGQLASTGERDGFGELSPDGTLTYYYDTSMSFTTAADARYRLVISPAAGENSLITAMQIAAFSGEEELFSITVAHYRSQGSR